MRDKLPGEVDEDLQPRPKFADLVAKARKTVALLVQRDDARIFIPVTMG